MVNGNHNSLSFLNLAALIAYMHKVAILFARAFYLYRLLFRVYCTHYKCRVFIVHSLSYSTFFFWCEVLKGSLSPTGRRYIGQAYVHKILYTKVGQWKLANMYM